MATIAIMVGGAVLNAATFIGGNYLAKALSGDSGQAALDEKKRHDLALEKYQRDYAQYQKDRTQLLDWVAKQDREKNQAFHDFKDTDQALALYNQTHKNPSSLTTTNPARNKRIANCCSLAQAHLPLAMRPFASCKPYNIYAWRPNSLRSTTAPGGTEKGWPPSNNWLLQPRSLKMLRNKMAYQTSPVANIPPRPPLHPATQV